jgi:hypothetical protein
MIRGKTVARYPARPLQVFFPYRKVADSGGAAIRKQRHHSHSDEDLASRTSSGSVSTDITWPTSHRVKAAVVAECCAKDVRRSVSSSLVQRGVWPSAIGDPFEREPIGDPGRAENDGGGRTYGREI